MTKKYSMDLNAYDWMKKELNDKLKQSDKRYIESLFYTATIIAIRYSHSLILVSDIQEAVEEINQDTLSIHQKIKENRRLDAELKFNILANAVGLFDLVWTADPTEEERKEKEEGKL